MTTERIRGYCPRCRHDQLFERAVVHHKVHLFLTLITFGLWGVSWLAIYIMRRLRPWCCVQCGRYASSSQCRSNSSKPPTAALKKD